MTNIIEFSLLVCCVYHLFNLITVTNAATQCGSDFTWKPFEDKKCFKIIDQFLTHTQAQNICTTSIIGTEELQPSLLTINSLEEQKFLTKWIFQELQVVHNVWLDFGRRNNSLKFESDIGPLEFTYWRAGSPSSDLDRKCAQVTSKLSRYPNGEAVGIDGLWSDVSCINRNLVVCQISQTWSLLRVQQELLNVEKEMKKKLETLQALQTTHETLVEKHNHFEAKMHQLIDDLLVPKPRSCLEIQNWSLGLPPLNETKQYIYPFGQGGIGVEIQCDFVTNGGGWTIIQRRRKGPMFEFYKDWLDYEEGFGSLDGNYWIGLRTISALNLASAQELRIELGDWEGTLGHAQYSHFALSPSWDFYRIYVGGYSGDVGDSLSQHNGMRFSTKDKDNDDNSSVNCAQLHHGSWWYYSNGCYNSNLNGLYFKYGDSVPDKDGLHWNSWMGNEYSLRSVEMKIRDAGSYKMGQCAVH